MPGFVMKHHLQSTTLPAKATVHSGHGDVSPRRKTWFPTFCIRITNSPAGLGSVETLATYPKAPSWSRLQSETRQGSSSCCWRTMESAQLASHTLPSYTAPCTALKHIWLFYIKDIVLSYPWSKHQLIQYQIFPTSVQTTLFPHSEYIKKSQTVVSLCQYTKQLRRNYSTQNSGVSFKTLPKKKFEGKE